MVSIVQGFNVSGAAQAFGLRNAAATKVLDADLEITAKEFSEKGGDIAAAKPTSSLQGGLNQSLTNFSDFQPPRQPNVKDSIRQETNTLSFAVQNAFELPFERQGDFTLVAGQTGRRLKTSA